MFESVVSDPGADGLQRASRIFYVMAVMIPLAALMRAGIAVIDSRPLDLPGLAINIVFTILAHSTGRGIAAQKRWAKWMGYALGTIELLYFPIGTVIGIAIWVYLIRATRAGLFAQRAVRSS